MGQSTGHVCSAAARLVPTKRTDSSSGKQWRRGRRRRNSPASPCSGPQALLATLDRWRVKPHGLHGSFYSGVFPVSTTGHSGCVLQYVQSGPGRSNASWASAHLDGHTSSPAVWITQQPLNNGHQLWDGDRDRQSDTAAALWGRKGSSSVSSSRRAIPLLLATLLHFPPVFCTGSQSSSRVSLPGGSGHLDWLLLLHLQPFLLWLPQQTDSGRAGQASSLSVSPCGSRDRGETAQPWRIHRGEFPSVPARHRLQSGSSKLAQHL